LFLFVQRQKESPSGRTIPALGIRRDKIGETPKGKDQELGRHKAYSYKTPKNHPAKNKPPQKARLL